MSRTCERININEGTTIVLNNLSSLKCVTDMYRRDNGFVWSGCPRPFSTFLLSVWMVAATDWWGRPANSLLIYLSFLSLLLQLLPTPIFPGDSDAALPVVEVVVQSNLANLMVTSYIGGSFLSRTCGKHTALKTRKIEKLVLIYLPFQVWLCCIRSGFFLPLSPHVSFFTLIRLFDLSLLVVTSKWKVATEEDL